MTDLDIRSLLARLRLASKDTVCEVEGCDSTDDVEIVDVLPLDPIDHSATVLGLCSDHQEWAARRNELAEDVADELREARKEIGQEHISEIQRLASPMDGNLREDFLMGDVEGTVTLKDIHTDERPSPAGERDD